jgi:pilus assembly protein FimV
MQIFLIKGLNVKSKLIKNVNFGYMLAAAIALSSPLSASADQHHHKHKHSHASGHKASHPKEAAHENGPAATHSEGAGETYIVQSGDVFGKVAQKYQPAGMPLKKVMKDIYAVNKQAFVNGDQKRLIVGAELHIPSSLAKVTKPAETVSEQATGQVTTKPTPTPSVAAVPNNTKTEKLDSKKPSAGALLEDNPKNPAAQVLPAKPVSEVATKTPTEVAPASIDLAMTPAASAPEAAPVATAPAEALAEPNQAESLPERHDTGLNGFVLFGLLAAVIGAIIFWRTRAMKRDKAQKEWIDELMKNNSSD